jgi:peptidyl-prolyl cis-trans isomerase D
MAILGKIRQRSLFLILIIGMALFAFVLSGIFTNAGQASQKSMSSIGTVNGKSIDIESFRAQVETAKRQYGPSATTSQLVNNVWDSEVRAAILESQYDALGISIEKDQIWNTIISNQQIISNPEWQNEDGLFDENKLREYIARIKATATDDPLAAQQYQAWVNFEQSTANIAREQMYFNLIKAGTVATLKEGELQYKMENDKVDIQYVQIPYTSIADSTVTVTKAEISDYIDAHENQFKVDESRNIQYVVFDEKPSKADEDAVYASINKLLSERIEFNEVSKLSDTLPGFADVKDNAAFVNTYSDVKFDATFKLKSQLPVAIADSIFNLEVGQLYGPYTDGNLIKVTKMVAKKEKPEVKSSHILIAYEGALRVNPEIKRTKTEAEAAAKKALAQAKKTKTDAEFAELAKTLSDGPSAPQGGDLGFNAEGVMTPKFNDFTFNNKVGTIGMVETDFGFHIIKVTDRKSDPVVQTATLGLTMEPSEETINSIFVTTTKFEMESKKDKPFIAVASENNYQVRPVNTIKEMDENIPGIGNQRSIVQWAFNPESSVGDVKRFNLTRGYAVVQLTAATSKGVSSVEDASAKVLPILRRNKKAAMIKANNTATTLEALASANNTSVKSAPSISMQAPTIAGAGSEPRVVGSAFALKEGEISKLIQGEKGVYMVKVTKVDAAPSIDNYSANANRLTSQKVNTVNLEVFKALKAAAEIEDNRANFY